MLLAGLLLACSGCAQHWCQLPDDFACAFRHTQLGWELQDVWHNCPLDRCVDGVGTDRDCGVHVYEEEVWLDEPRPAQRPRIAVGPPPERFRPELPPSFLPVPARSVFSPVNMHAPQSGNQMVEHGMGRTLVVPAGD